ncbi:MAG: hypothetical protein NC311_12390 [Muribaculaceae bacterium]|nr:hypothetical protein [Muribaculaceae bacterium]
MAASTAEKLNNYGISFLPAPFHAKNREEDKENGAIYFKPKNGKRSLLSSRKLTLVVIDKIKTKFGGLVKITYKLLDELAGIKHTTAWRSLKELEADGFIENHGESDYTIKPAFSGDEFTVLYEFLLTEELDLGKIKKRLSRNAVIELCNIIQFYLNEDNKYKYFIGGDKRVASFLNVAQGTANGIVKELEAVGTITSFIAHYDSAGNIILKPGKGKSVKEFTVYKVNPKLLSRCKRIQKYYSDMREAKAKAAEAQRQANEQAQKADATPATSADKKPRKKRVTAPKTKSIIEEWAPTIAKLCGQTEPNDPFKEFQHWEQPPNKNN